jgi:hypothetical protein
MEEYSEGLGEVSQVILDLRWEMDLRLNFGIICGVGTRPLRKPFQFYLVFACVKDASVVTHLELSNGSNQWNVSFVRAAHD